MGRITIIGGGIAGLYLAYNFSKKKKHCILIEKSNYLGGRICTYKDDFLGTIEAGAGRFLLSHKYLIKLLKDLDLYNKKGLNKISTEYKPMLNFTSIYKNKKQINSLIRKVIDSSKKESYKFLCNIIFIDYIKRILSKDESQLLYDSFGYSTELTIMNTHDAIQLINNHLLQTRFYHLSGGLYQIVERLKEILDKSEYVTIYTNNNIESIKENKSGSYQIISKKFEIETDICICAVPVPSLRELSIFSNIKESLDRIICAPLCRIYSVINNASNILPNKFTTNSDIKIYIPIYKDVAMISYTDNDYARKWKKIYDDNGIKDLNRQLKKELEKTVGPIVSMPKHTKIFYWECGVGYWGKGSDSKNFNIEPKPNLFICGENVSELNQQWIEGALDTSHMIIKKCI